MTKEELIRTQVLIPEHQVMNGFCYSFSRVLVNELEKLESTKMLYQPDKDGVVRPTSQSTCYYRHTSHVTQILLFLSDQMSEIELEGASNIGSSSEIDLKKFLDECNRFLAIFEQKAND